MQHSSIRPKVSTFLNELPDQKQRMFLLMINKAIESGTISAEYLIKLLSIHNFLLSRVAQQPREKLILHKKTSGSLSLPIQCRHEPEVEILCSERNTTSRLWVSTDHDAFCVGVSVVVGNTKEEAHTLLTQELNECGLDGNRPFTLTEIEVSTPGAHIIVGAQY